MLLAPVLRSHLPAIRERLAPLDARAGGDLVLQFGVADVDAAARLLRERGVPLVTLPHDQPAWRLRICHVSDPAGHVLEMSAPLAPSNR